MQMKASYDGASARNCAELCNVVYERPSAIRKKISELFDGADMDLSSIFLNNCRILVVSTESEIYVVFRGTVIKSIRSTLTNAFFNKAAWGKGAVHAGFLSIFEQAEFFIHRMLRKHRASRKKLIFAGHSQGGAVAYLAAMTFTMRSGLANPDSNYTFGQPRSGNASFSRDADIRLDAILSRIVNGSDPVVGLPFVWLGYDHTRDYLRYDKDWKIRQHKQTAGESWPVFHGSIADHYMLQYLRRSHCN